jgi:hypothetical protein
MTQLRLQYMSVIPNSSLLQPVALSRKGYALLRTYSTDISIGRIIWCTKERNIYICGH